MQTESEFSVFVMHGDYVLLVSRQHASIKSYGPLSGEARPCPDTLVILQST